MSGAPEWVVGQLRVATGDGLQAVALGMLQAYLLDCGDLAGAQGVMRAYVAELERRASRPPAPLPRTVR